MTASQGRGLDALGLHNDLREALFRYYDTPFGLANPAIQTKRRELLDKDGATWRTPLLEVRPRYESAGMPLAESAMAAGAMPGFADLVSRGLLDGIPMLYRHQHDTLIGAYRDGRDVVNTAGTGSGKTEAFLLPIVADLVRESASWTGSRAPYREWWTAEGAEFVDQRRGESGRPVAMRAMVLYPMNALVDDQMTRLRRALDSDDVRDWLNDNRRGHRFYFGRYTGATPVPGTPDSKPSLTSLRTYLHKTHLRAATAQEADGDARYFIPRLDGAEMRSRWDMIAAPPDLLITNYSMLNVMLQRDREAGFFDMTRQWLDTTPGAKFTLAIDELHTYRGTAGTEVAYLLRAFFHRLGLDKHPERLRILAASASLDADRDRGFLEDFFGIPRERFLVLAGEEVKTLSAPADLASSADTFAKLGDSPDPATAEGALASTKAPAALVAALRDGGRNVARSASAVAATLFPSAPQELQTSALSGLLAALRTADDPQGQLPKLRAHLFFRNVSGMWACSDPACPRADRPDDSDRTVGRLYTEPATRCLCGARVLELLYCQTCGDVFLGGFSSWEAIRQRGAFTGNLLADAPELERLPDQAPTRPSAANYVLYWPRTAKTEVSRLKRSRDNGTAEFEFVRSVYDPSGGRLENMTDGTTGWSFHTRYTGKGGPTAARKYLDKLSPLPTECPACGDDLEVSRFGKKVLSATDSRRLRSPIRTMRTGFEKVNQVLATRLMDSLPPTQRKLVVFTDSRQDAAKLSSGLALRHFQDLLRLLLAEELAAQGDPAADVTLVRALILGSEVDRQAAKAAGERLRLRWPQEFARLKDIWRGDDFGPEPSEAEEAELTAVLRRRPDLDTLASGLEPAMLALGTNPGGPAASLQHTRGKDESARFRWPELYTWQRNPPERRPGQGTLEQELGEEIRESLRTELIMGLFAGAGRDAESLGLGWLCLSDDETDLAAPQTSDAALVRTSLRLLGQLRRFRGMRWGTEEPPASLKHYWEEVARVHGLDTDDVRRRVEQGWRGAVTEYIIDPGKVALRPGVGTSWTCTNCHRRHMHPGTGICTKSTCRRPLTSEPEPFVPDSDYYAWLATEGIGRFPLRTAELTGQTDRVEAQARQARFQEIFLDDTEVPEADTIDLLSVTTTMEAGVDIGALSAVVMANMPPTRFNYQQRVGRAGRRGSPVAAALTVCRGRSHDEYYFKAPEKITNEATPAPYLSLNMPDIYVRVLYAEVLRMAFAEAGVQTADGEEADPTRNVHGQFGLASNWPAARDTIAAWITRNEQRVKSTAAALAIGTSEKIAAIDVMTELSQFLTRVDDAAAAPGGHPDLSQRLAEAGCLPMFGFPTGARYLYTALPGRSFPWPPPGAVDRDLPIAISQFAPGSETVRDGSVYTSIGVTAFRPAGFRPAPEAEPLGSSWQVAFCRTCSHIDDAPPSADGDELVPCPACGANEGEFHQVDLREPAGFRAWKPRDFDGNFTFTARAMAARTAADLVREAPERARGDRWVVHAGRGRRFTVNDHGGRLFRFQKASHTGMNWGGYVSLDALEDLDLPATLAAAGTPLEVALGTAQHSDMLFFGTDNPGDADAGLQLGLGAACQQSGFIESRQARRAAWYSLAAVLRETAGPFLDVQPLELEAGIHGAPGQDGGRIFAFLTDTLENGAGYCGHIVDRLPEFLDRVDVYLAGLAADPDHASCSASCYKCLRDYTNMPYHALFDWRLARDLFSVLRGRDLAIDHGRLAELTRSWAASVGAETLSTDHGTAAVHGDLFGPRIAVVPKHPLESAATDATAKRLVDAAAATRAASGCETVLFIDSFTLDRLPGAVLNAVEDHGRVL